MQCIATTSQNGAALCIWVYWEVRLAQKSIYYKHRGKYCAVQPCSHTYTTMCAHIVRKSHLNDGWSAWANWWRKIEAKVDLYSLILPTPPHTRILFICTRLVLIWAVRKTKNMYIWHEEWRTMEWWRGWKKTWRIVWQECSFSKLGTGDPNTHSKWRLGLRRGATIEF